MSFQVALGVLLIDVLLSGDNAIIIALVCHSLSLEHRRKALWLGVAGALLARLVLTAGATLVMHVPLIKLVGGFLLLKISIDLIVDNSLQDAASHTQEPSSAQDVWTAARTIVVADIVMSLDNVLALSAVTQNNWLMLAAGLLLSIPILMFGSVYVGRLLDTFPRFLWLGGAILGGVSGSLMVDDPIFGGAFNNASSMAPAVVPLVLAACVVPMSRVIAANTRRMQAEALPPSLWRIFWPQEPDHRPEVVASTARAEAALMTPTAPETAPALASAAKAAEITAVAVSQTTTEEVPAAATPPAQPSSRAEYRILIALGAFVMLAGGGLHLMFDVLQPSVPDNFITYICARPPMTISYLPHAQEIRFATSEGAIKTTITEDRVVWDNYREASTKLGIPPPVSIVAADVRQLVVNGGMFENTNCRPATQRP